MIQQGPLRPLFSFLGPRTPSPSASLSSLWRNAETVGSQLLGLKKRCNLALKFVPSASAWLALSELGEYQPVEAEVSLSEARKREAVALPLLWAIWLCWWWSLRRWAVRYLGEKGQFCNSLDPHATGDSLCRAAPVPLWQSQCSVHLPPSLDWMTLTWRCLRSSAPYSSLLAPWLGVSGMRTGGRMEWDWEANNSSVPDRKLSGLGWVAGRGPVTVEMRV